MKKRKKTKVRRRFSITDPFGNAPAPRKGMTQMWADPDLMDEYREAGWSRVKKAKRVFDMVLMERPAQLTEAAREKEISAARIMFSEAEANNKGPEYWKTMSPVMAKHVDYTPEAFQSAKDTLNVEPHTLQAYADVAIRVAVSDKEIKSAMYLGLSPGEYIRRLVIMDTDWLMRVSRSSFDDIVHPVFARGVVKIEPVEKSDGSSS